MAGEEQGNVWPLPKFYFSVQLGDDKDVSFQEVTGLQTETKAIEYRHGNSPYFSPVKMPGLRSVGNVTMKKGIFAKDAKFFAWYSEITMNLIKRRTVVINLLNEKGDPQVTWTLNNAWPTKITGTDLKSDGNEVAVESIELVFETLEIKAA
jgi:phage tail-like protein